MEETDATRKRFRNDDGAEPGNDSAAVKRLREDLLDSFDDDYDEVGTSNEDLYLFMKKFEEEITASPSAAAVVDCVDSDLCSFSGESSTNLSYLLKASDDDLGIPAPPSTLPSEEGVLEAEPLVSPEPTLLESGNSLFEETSGFGFRDLDNGDGEFGTFDLDGMFDYADLGFGSDGLPFRPESLSAQ